jgi:hypothetical protein
MTDGPNHPNGRVRDGSGTPALRSTARAATPDCVDSCSAFVTERGKGGKRTGVSEVGVAGLFVIGWDAGTVANLKFFVPVVSNPLTLMQLYGVAPTIGMGLNLWN